MMFVWPALVQDCELIEVVVVPPLFVIVTELSELLTFIVADTFCQFEALIGFPANHPML